VRIANTEGAILYSLVLGTISAGFQVTYVYFLGALCNPNPESGDDRLH
jgi:hypothetical protein